MRNRIQRPSPALVVASLALFVSLGGVGYAAATISTSDIKNGAVTGKKIKNRTITTKDISRKTVGALKGAKGAAGPQGPQGIQGPAGEPATKLFAAVSESGDLARGSSAVSAVRTATGQYSVVFNRGITDCVYVATVGDDTFSAIPAILSTTQLNSTTVRVRSSDNTGADFNRPFYLAVLC